MVDVREYIKKDKQLPNDLTGQFGKTLAVDITETVYEFVNMSSSPGEIFMWPLDTPPGYGLSCDGSTYNFDDYPVLGAILGGIAGGTFNVPVINFVKNSVGVDTLSIEPQDVESHTHLVQPIPDHNHGGSISSNGGHAHSIAQAGSSTYSNVSSASPRDITFYKGTTTDSVPDHNHGLSIYNNGGHTPIVDDSLGNKTQPECTLVHFCIRF